VRQENQLSTPGRLTTVDEVETTVGRPAPMVMLKQISNLDQGCRTVLARCPIAAFGYRDADGTSRTTFIGGTPGFARVHSPTRISFSLPESGDPHGPVSLFFLLPGVGELLRVNGSVAARKGAQTAVDIKEAYVHCAQAVLRSRLWQPKAPAGPATAIAGDGPLRRPGVAQFLAAAPFLALSTWDSCGGSDTSPRGDRQTAARILDGVLTRRDGRLDQDRVRRWVTGLSPARDAHYYICGPQKLTNAVQEALTGLGVRQELVHHERYTSAAHPGTTATMPQEMTVEENGHPVGTVMVKPGQTLLDAGLAAGLPMPHSCTVGNCGDCMVRLHSGEVTQNEPNCLTPQQQADGYVLTCVGCPHSKVTLDIADP